MKKVLRVLIIALALVGVLVIPALAAKGGQGKGAQKVTLIPYPGGTDPGGGFVIFNDTSGPDNVQTQMSLKGAPANTVYDVWVMINDVITHVGTVTTNPKGNANFHCSYSEAGSGVQKLGLALWRGGWQFHTDTVFHSFK